MSQMNLDAIEERLNRGESLTVESQQRLLRFARRAMEERDRERRQPRYTDHIRDLIERFAR